MKKPGITIFIIVTLVLVTVFSGCRKNGTSSEKKSFSNKTQQTSSKPAEQPVAPEKNPTGDIPDT